MAFHRREDELSAESLRVGGSAISLQHYVLMRGLSIAGCPQDLNECTVTVSPLCSRGPRPPTCVSSLLAGKPSGI